ncbi:sulfate transporter-like [Aplysia californica]|uniref:Sulfate transporter-like n=1 Tax=Aplysia californica TaxID=6500 RepID=A0ABM1VYM6_APLCA|nr:sulfate transporter-like [Aplysia californica]
MYSARSTGSLELVDPEAEGVITKYPKLVEFEETFRDPEDNSSLFSRIPLAVKGYFSECDVTKSVNRFFPFIKTIRKYKVKEDLPNDLIAGITSGVMMIPQGMAFAALSTLPPIVGLYISFFASITYFFLGTGRQLSWGCIAILSLMIATILDKYDSSVAGELSLVCLNGTLNGQSVPDSLGSLPEASTVAKYILTMYSARSTGSLELVDPEAEVITKYPKLVEFEETFRDPEDNSSLFSRIPLVVKGYFSECDVTKSVNRFFPFIKTIRKYKVKEDLPNDLIAGITSGVMMIPQGMAFAALSTLPPIVGLYISFFASITYFFLGTGRQLSWGCIAILSLMIATILDKYDSSVAGELSLVCLNGTLNGQSVPDSLGSLPEASTVANTIADTTSSSLVTDYVVLQNTTHSGSSKTAEEMAAIVAKRMEVASGVSVAAGLILILASRVGLSKITNLMSDSLITGFTVGISFHVATSQLKSLLGLSIPRFKGIASVIRTWIEILKKLPETNIATLIISIICMLVIYLVKRCINERFKKRMRIPVPIELFVVIVATLISTFANLNETYDVPVVEDVPIGVPAPKFPDLTLVTDYIGDGIVIIIVSYAQTLAMAKTMGLKHNYQVDANQEMLACGACSVVCGLFSSYITGASVSRSVVQDGAGGRTQIASLFAAGLVLLVIMVIGPYFYYLPMCVLSSIIVVNLRTMFLKLLVIPTEWRKSRYDCAVWVFTCVATIVLNADMGLLAGVVFSLFLVVMRSMITPVVEAGQIQTGAFNVELRSLSKYSSATKLQSVKIIKIKTPLYFVNANIFTAKVFQKTGIEPIVLKKQLKEAKKVVETADKDTEHMNGTMLGTGPEDTKVIVLDASEVAFIDLMGVQALQFLISEFVSVDKEVLITSIPESILPMLHSTGFWAKNGDRLFLSVEAALASIVTTAETKKD